MSVEDDLVTLYGVAPEEFTALRKELVAAAKKRGDEDAARTIAASRRPTTAAWVLNRLVRTDDSVRARLGGLTAELRAAHAAMDGPRIRELTRTQRTLIAELVRAAFEAAELSNPSAALREDVTGTLQAAIADPEVAGRLGSLEKAEQFSGFGEFGAVTATAPSRAPRTAAPARPKAPAQPTVPAKELRAARVRRDAAAKADAAARKAAESAAAEAEELRTRASTALRRYQKILDTLSAAEEEMNTATAELDAAERAAAKADEAAAKAAADLSEAEDALADLDAG